MSKLERKIEILSRLEEIEEILEIMGISMNTKQYKSVCPDWVVNEFQEVRDSLKSLIYDYDKIV